MRDAVAGALTRAAGSLRRLAHAARRAASSAAAPLRGRSPASRASFRTAATRLEHEAVRLEAWLGPRLERLAAELVRRAPSRRQATFGAGILLVVALTSWDRCGLGGCPDVDRLASYQPGGAPVLLDRHGEQFATLAPMEYEVIHLDSLPEYVAQAFVAVEDKRFFAHGGVDWVRVFGALWADIRAGGPAEGSSTIPMQLARTLFPDRIRRQERSLRRKLLEVRVAREIERRFTKQEILELYLNHIYLGGGAYGVESASRYYFGKSARELALEEAALLAALPKAPAPYDPRRHAEAARDRRDLVLSLMAAQELITEDEAREASEREVRVTAEPERGPAGERLAPYFVQQVRRFLEDELGGGLYAQPLRIVTTLDARVQEAAEAALTAQLRTVERGAFGRLDGAPYRRAAQPDADRTGYLQGALVVMDARDGDVLAWIGGRDYAHSRFDRARLARRQAGSAFKPFVYAAAIESGFVASQPILDEPYRFATDGGKDWEPENYSGEFEGRMSMREALVRSQNVPAARLAAAVGDAAVADLARRAGIAGEVPSSPVAALGVTAVSPLELAEAYSAFAGQGTRVAPRFVLRVEDADGKVLWESEPERERVLDPAVAFVVTDMLRDAVDRGTGAAARGAGYRGPAAGKTGTTDDATDAWFAGFTPELVGVVWVGFDEVRPLPGRATGGGVAAPVWGRVMARAYRRRPDPEPWQPPAGIVALRVDPETGMALEEGCRPWRGEPQREHFLEGTEPPTVCPRRGGGNVFEQIGRWLGSVFGIDAGPEVPGEPDPNLGVPRLPRRGEAEHVEVGDERDAGSW